MSSSAPSAAAAAAAASERSPLLPREAAARGGDVTVVVVDGQQQQVNVAGAGDREEEEVENSPPFGHEHYSHRSPWLRAAVLGANDGLVSTTSLMLGIAAADADFHRMILAGVAGLVGGALSMACGEFVSVHSQKDAEESDIRREREEFLKGPEHVAKEMEELAGTFSLPRGGGGGVGWDPDLILTHHGCVLLPLQEVYVTRGLSEELARRVAEELHAKCDLDEIVKVHIRDEMGIDTDEMSNPIQAAAASASAFAVGALLPLAAALIFQDYVLRVTSVTVVASLALATFGVVGAVLGEVFFWLAVLWLPEGARVAN
ncbi:MAG: VIT family-domain-containing protein [Olpidium bornovanus]|uniref:VIT family-domain-containing protein n=1 Tax=Olpidium bornovanus TaxID=278681 RepID=A0A8H7ZXS3_9FUNG|nr:MAG: VIT family-domain-containing protein [Olpidium bornovanus]